MQITQVRVRVAFTGMGFDLPAVSKVCGFPGHGFPGHSAGLVGCSVYIDFRLVPSAKSLIILVATVRQCDRGIVATGEAGLPVYLQHIKKWHDIASTKSAKQSIATKYGGVRSSVLQCYFDFLTLILS